MPLEIRKICDYILLLLKGGITMAYEEIRIDWSNAEQVRVARNIEVLYFKKIVKPLYEKGALPRDEYDEVRNNAIRLNGLYEELKSKPQ